MSQTSYVRNPSLTKHRKRESSVGNTKKFSISRNNCFIAEFHFPFRITASSNNIKSTTNFVHLFLRHSSGAQSLLQAPCSGITPGRAGGILRCQESNPGSAICKTSTLSNGLLLWSLPIFFSSPNHVKGQQ